MTTAHTATPTQSLEFVCEWFERARKNAVAMGKNDAALLWGDGLVQLRRMAEQRADLVAVAQAILTDDLLPLLPAEYIEKVRAALAKAGAA